MQKQLQQFQTYLEARHVKDSTIDQYLLHAEKFYSYVKKKPTEQDLYKYLKTLEKYSANYRNLKFKAIKKFYKSCGWKFPYDEGEGTVKVKKEPDRPKHSNEEIIQMIKNRHLLSNREQALLALSTIFGFRRSDLAVINEENFNEKKNLLNFEIVKTELPISHFIPVEIRKIIKEHEFYTLSSNTLSGVYKKILSKTKVKSKKHKGKRFGWHSIRRRVLTELLNVHSNPYEVHQFMGWKSEKAMREELGIQLPKIMIPYSREDPIVLDKKIMKVHPYLKYWK